MISEPRSTTVSSLMRIEVHEHHDFGQPVGTIAVVSQPCAFEKAWIDSPLSFCFMFVLHRLSISCRAIPDII